MDWEDLSLGDNLIQNINIGILVDDHPESPRDWDGNLGHMVCFHGRYNLGESHDFKEPDDLHKHLRKIDRENGVYLPLYLYDHSGLTMGTSNDSWPFNCPWDAGQVGYIYASAENIRNFYGCKRVTQNMRKQALETLQHEVDDYAKYLEGDIYGFVITDEDGEHLDSCWGFWGFDYVRQEAAAAAKSYLKDILVA